MSAMDEGLKKFLTFLPEYCDEFVGKYRSLKSVAHSHRAKVMPAWKAAQNLYSQKLTTLDAVRRKKVEHWEFVVCDMSGFEPVAFLPRLVSSWERVRELLSGCEIENALTNAQAHTLSAALQSPSMKGKQEAIFAPLFLDRYEQDHLTVDQKAWLTHFTETVCVVVDAELESTQKGLGRFLRFLAHHSGDIVGEKYGGLKSVVNANRAKTSSKWKAAQHFWNRKFQLLDTDSRQVVED